MMNHERFRLKQCIRLDDEGSSPIMLTDREKDVLAWAARGKTSAETAIILKISVETVTTHIKNALVKLSATNKVHGVAKAIYHDLIHP